MDDRYDSQSQYYPPPPSSQQQQQRDDQSYSPRQSSSRLGSGGSYRPSLQPNYSNSYVPSTNALQYSPSYTNGSNTHLVPYAPGEYYGLSSRPDSSGPGGVGERHHHSHRSRSQPSRKSSYGGSRDKGKDGKHSDKKKEIAAALIGAAGGGLLGREIGGGGVATILGAAVGALAGDRFEKDREKKKSERSHHDRKHRHAAPYIDYDDRQRDLPDDRLYDSEEEVERRPRSLREHRSRSRHRRYDDDSD